MNILHLSDGELELIEIALVEKIASKRKEIKSAFEFSDLDTVERKIDELKQFQKLSQKLPVKI